MSKFVKVLDKTEKKLEAIPKLSQNYIKTITLLGNVLNNYINLIIRPLNFMNCYQVSF